MRKGIFAKNVQDIESYEKNDNDQDGDGIPDIALKLNWMADMTEEEKAGRLNDLGDFNAKNADFIEKLNQETEVFTEDGPEDL